MVQPPTQDEGQVPQEEGIEQGRAQEEKDKEEEVPWAASTQVRTTIQRSHPVDQILGDISKGVTTKREMCLWAISLMFWWLSAKNNLWVVMC